MSRDILRFDSGAQTVWNATLAQNTIGLANITANATHSLDVAPVDAWVDLNGYIRSITIHATAATAINVIFYAKASGEAVTPASAAYIDHHPFTAGDFFSGESATVLSAHVNDLSIKYNDDDRTKTFHVALQGPGASGIPIGTSADIRVQFTWEARGGEN